MTSRCLRNPAQTSEVTINHVKVSCITQTWFCRIWSLVIYPNHHHISAPNLSANTLFKFSSLEKSFWLTVKSTLKWENGPNDILFYCNCLLLQWQNCILFLYFIMTYTLLKYKSRQVKLNIFSLHSFYPSRITFKNKFLAFEDTLLVAFLVILKLLMMKGIIRENELE